jgi:predicted aspartyl protease
MPKSIYESLNLWKLSEGGERISLANNAVILPIGIAEGVHTKICVRTISIDYLVIECVGKGQITLGRSLLKLLGAKIDMENGIMTFNSPPSASHSFPKSKVKKGRHRAATNYGVDASSFENT